MNIAELQTALKHGRVSILTKSLGMCTMKRIERIKSASDRRSTTYVYAEQTPGVGINLTASDVLGAYKCAACRDLIGGRICDTCDGEGSIECAACNGTTCAHPEHVPCSGGCETCKDCIDGETKCCDCDGAGREPCPACS